MTELEILEDPSTSYWLKAQIQLTKERDIADAISDVECLLEILNARFRQYLDKK